MIKSCIILLLVTACSVQAKVISNYSRNEIASSHLDTEMDMISKATYNIPISGNSSDIPTKKPLDCAKKPLDCADVFQMGQNKSGAYEIWPVNRVTEGKHLYVYCDMETNGGGWTVIQRRGDFQRAKDYFFQDWKNYKEGFGAIERDFWLGNDNIFALTNQKLYSVRFDLKDFQGNRRYAHYDNFWIADEDHKYTLQISSYVGDAGNLMSYHNNRPFSTKDQNNNNATSTHCAKEHKGGWWYRSCYSVNLNGLYHKGKYDTIDGISWLTWTGYRESLAWTEMKIRPKNFRLSYS